MTVSSPPLSPTENAPNPSGPNSFSPVPLSPPRCPRNNVC
jgi:hypothetical protein